MSMEFLLTSIVVILLPGAGVLYTLAWGLGGGMRAGIVAAFGCTMGIVPHIVASIIGLAALLHASAMAFQIVKYVGVVYLLYMAWSILRDQGPLEISELKKQIPAIRIVTNGFLINSVNPKLSFFFLAFLPQFVPANAAHATAEMLFLAAIFMLLTFVVFVGYGTCASLTRAYMAGRPQVMIWLRRSFAGAFGLLGLRLAFADR